MPTGWRLVKKRYAANAFDGEGARLYGGRWNSPGVPMVYTAATLSLAALELLVHLNDRRHLAGYQQCAAHFESHQVTVVEGTALPEDWRKYPAPEALRQIGGRWAEELATPVLRVPSAVVPQEGNFLLNPLHPAFRELVFNPPGPLSLDSRLLGD